jgi:membrane AbrB-like protein
VLEFDRETLRAIRRILPTALALIAVLNLAVAGLGVVLANVAGLSQLDGYLATSPGGIYAVLGTTIGSDSDVAFVMTSQVIRVVLMLFAAPLVAKLFLRYAPDISIRRHDGHNRESRAVLTPIGLT